MSIKVMTWVWEHSPRKGSELLVLLALADFADDNGICWPSISRLATKTRISPRQTQRIIELLSAEKDVQILEKGDGRGHSSRYQVSTVPISKDDKMSPFTSVPERVTSSAERVTSGTERVTDLTVKSDIAMSPESSIEPSEESSRETPAPRSRTRPLQTAEEIVAQLSADPAYAHINVPHEFLKTQTWLRDHPDRRFTKRFFIKWLNRIDPPVNTSTPLSLPTPAFPSEPDWMNEIHANFRSRGQSSGGNGK